eukprot:Cvel_16869.t1-p1 / transcript=Cvel_16869.t1 / gene=Cvel_16869 / organism=Chromera_velia_CCMP2878 / gene_product=hypothetical protein / transcript_product=hypothetical protein / location=Cvel_scaffold1319:48431-48830(+) / protein_length=133 / sequence_SO=supercontig / SO=protein_coding / is_pseudo=false
MKTDVRICNGPWDLEIYFKIGVYRCGCQLGGFRFLRSLHSDWRPEVESRLFTENGIFDDDDEKAMVILKEWKEVEFLIFECGYSWEEILRRVCLEPSLHERAAAAGAPPGLLRDGSAVGTEDGCILTPIKPIK